MSKKHMLTLLAACVLCIGLLGGCSAPEQPVNSTPDLTAAVSGKPTDTPVPSESASIAPAGTIEPMITSEPADDDMVCVTDYMADIYVELKYATTDNFTGSILYDFSDAYLRYGTVKKLMSVQDTLTGQGYSLKIWDSYRPVSAQFALWEICPDPTYVANPNTGYSSHSKGNTVDVTLVDLDGTEVDMPTGFDDFSALADRDYSDVSTEPAANAKRLEETMKDNGFGAYSGEWWHFSDTNAYSVIESLDVVLE